MPPSSVGPTVRIAAVHRFATFLLPAGAPTLCFLKQEAVMSLAGQGIVAIWHDIVPEGRQEFYEWHNREHMPERLSIPGFRRGRRYIAVSGASPMFFCFYEGAGLDVVAGPDYLQRLNNPSEWTRRMMPHFRNMSRSVCHVWYSEGPGEGGFAATMRFAGVDDSRLCTRVLPDLINLSGVVGVHFCVANDEASGIPTVEKTFRKAVDLCPTSIVIVEGSSASCVQSAATSVNADLESAADVAVYQLGKNPPNLQVPSMARR